MKLAIGAPDLSKETLLFAQQLGITYLKVNGGLFLDENLRGQINSSELKNFTTLQKSMVLMSEQMLILR